VIDADRVSWTHYRVTAAGREPIAAAHHGLHYQPSRRVGLGTITSRRPDPPAEPAPVDILAAIKAGARHPCRPPSR
jgi:hypothetical protein